MWCTFDLHISCLLVEAKDLSYNVLFVIVKIRYDLRRWHISPLLFYLVEEVVNKGIYKVVIEGQVELIKGTWNVKVSSYCLFGDFIMVYSKKKVYGLVSLKNVFIRHA